MWRQEIRKPKQHVNRLVQWTAGRRSSLSKVIGSGDACKVGNSVEAVETIRERMVAKHVKLGDTLRY